MAISLSKLSWAVALLLGDVLSEMLQQQHANATSFQGSMSNSTVVKHGAQKTLEAHAGTETDMENQKPITCTFTMDNSVDSVFYAEKDITGQVKGSLSNWKSVKTVVIDKPQNNAYLVIAGHNHEVDGKACRTGGFQINCDNGVTSGSPWEAYGSDRAIYGPQSDGTGSGWTSPCHSSSAFYLGSARNVKKIFATNKRFGAFRIQLKGALKRSPSKNPITCSFTIDNFVDSVFYDGQDVTRYVAGNLRDWQSVKRVTVEKTPGAYFVVSGHNHESKSCKSGGFQIKCSNGITSSNPLWEAFGSDRAIYGPQKDGRGIGWGQPCASSSGFKLQSAPNVKKIFATDKKFASFRIQLDPLHPDPLDPQPPVPKNGITCQFTMDNKVDSVFYGEYDVTKKVVGNLGDWKAIKSLSVSGKPGAQLVIAGHNTESDGQACRTGGFQITCSNGITSNNAWEAFGSDGAINGPQKLGRADGWGEPCGSSSAFYLAADKSVRKIFATNQRYAAFRIMLVPSTSVTCEFTFDNQVDSVFYAWKDVKKSVKGDLSNWKSVKTLTVHDVPGAYLVIGGHNFENNGDACNTAGFQIKCSNGVTSDSGGWESFGSDAAIPSEQQKGLADGWGNPCSSKSGFYLSTDPRVKKIYATNKKYGVFRMQLTPLANELLTSSTTTTTTGAEKEIGKLKQAIQVAKMKILDTDGQLQKLKGKLKREEGTNTQLENLLSATRAERDRWEERTQHSDEMYKTSQQHVRRLQEKNSDLYKMIIETRSKTPSWKSLQGRWDGPIEAAKQAAAVAKQQLRGQPLTDAPVAAGVVTPGSAPAAPPTQVQQVTTEDSTPLLPRAAAAPPPPPTPPTPPPPTPPYGKTTNTRTGTCLLGIQSKPPTGVGGVVGPPHWHARMDEHTGKQFYTNVATGEVTSGPPECWDSAYYTAEQPCVC